MEANGEQIGRFSGSKRAQSRGRWVLFQAAAYFLLFQLLYFPLASHWPQVGDGEYGYKLVNLRAQVHARSSEQPVVVMVGSSMVGWGLNPGSMNMLRPGTPNGPVIFNFGINSGGVVVQLLCLKRLLADGIRPDLVLVEFHPEFLYDYYNTYAGKHFLADDRLQFQDLGVLRRYDPGWPSTQQKWLSQQFLPWHFHRKEMEKTCLLEWISPEKRSNIWNVTDRHGWEGAICERAGYKTGLPQADQVRSVAHQQTMLQHLEVDNRFVRAYQELLATCQGEHIPAVLVRLPQYSTMREQTPSELQARHDACLLQLRETNVPCIDARAWVPDEQFLDGFHLLIPGSVTFSQRLEREFLIPLLKQPGSLAQLSATNASPRR